MASPRHTCPCCQRSKGLYCEDCVITLEEPPPQQIQLPVKVDIVQHGETNARSTALHAALLAAADVRLIRHSGSRTGRRCSALDLPLPDYDPATTVVLFPAGPDAAIVGQGPPFERVVVLESTWKKARGLLAHPKLAGLRRVQLPPDVAATQFSWRRGDGGFRGAVDEGLSSIEAIHHCCRLLAGSGQSLDGLLRFFLLTKQLVEQRGALQTSRQEARKQQQQQRVQARAAAEGTAAPGVEQRGGPGPNSSPPPGAQQSAAGIAAAAQAVTRPAASPEQRASSDPSQTPVQTTAHTAAL